MLHTNQTNQRKGSIEEFKMATISSKIQILISINNKQR